MPDDHLGVGPVLVAQTDASLLAAEHVPSMEYRSQINAFAHEGSMPY